MFSGVFLNNKLFVGYMNRARLVKKILESLLSKKLALPQANSLPSSFGVQLHFHALNFLEYFMRKRLVFAPCY